MTLKREIKDAYIENGDSIYVKTHSNAVYVDDNETETLTQRLDNVKNSITEHTSQLDKNTNNKVNYVNVCTMFKAKGDGITDDIIALNNAKEYCKNNNLTLYFPSGKKFGVSEPFIIDKRIYIEGYGAEIIALNEMEALVTINEEVYYDGDGTSLQNRTDLFETVVMHLPKLNANKKAKKCLNHYQGVKINYDCLNLINCNGTSLFVRNATESIIDKLHIHADAKIGSVGVELFTNDITINSINAIDCHTLIKDRGVNIINNVHGWIKTKEILLGSTFFEMYDNSILTVRLNQCYADTYQYVFKSNSVKQNVQCNQLFVLYNTEIYTTDIPQPILFYCTASPNEYAFNWSSLDNSYIQGATNNNKIKFANFEKCNVKFDTNNFFVCVDGIKKLTNSSLSLKNGVTVTRRNIIRRDGGVINLNFTLKVDMSVTGKTDGIIKLGNIVEEALIPYDKISFLVSCNETENTDLQNTILTSALLEGYSIDNEWCGLLRIRIPSTLLDKVVMYVNGSVTYMNKQLINSSLNYRTDIS